MKRLLFLIVPLLVVLAAAMSKPVAVFSDQRPAPALTVKTYSLPRFARPTAQEVRARPDAAVVLDKNLDVKLSGPHIHPNPVFYIRKADGSFGAVSARGPPSQPSAVALAGTSSPSVPLALPSDSGATRDLSSNVLYSFPPRTQNCQQYQTADCYLLSPAAGLNYHNPWYAKQLVKKRADGLYSVLFHRSGPQTLVVNGLLPASTIGAQPDPSDGAVWIPLLEKAYCFERTGANTYASLNWGSSSAAFSDLGCTSIYVSLDSHLPTVLQASFLKGYPATLQTTPSATPPFIASHVYFILTCKPIPGTNDSIIVMVNPWGIDGGTFVGDIDPNDGVITVKQSDVSKVSQTVNVVTGFAMDVPLVMAGDADLDGHVTISDFLIFQNNFNKSGDMLWTDGDFDYDGHVTQSDFLIFQNNFNK